MSSDLSADRRYCRDVLPRVSRTFAVNIRLLTGDFGETVRIGYLLCRVADSLEDSWPGAPEDIRARFDRLVESLEGSKEAAVTLARGAAEIALGRADMELVAQLPRVQNVYLALPQFSREVLREAVTTMARGMSRYASREAERGAMVSYIDDEAELHDYCWIVAGCVGVMLTRLATAKMPATRDVEARRLELAPRVGEALQLTNILLDWPRDTRRGRCHVPATWLAEWNLEPADLVEAPRAGLGELSERMDDLARSALADVPEYVGLFPARHVRYRLFCLWPALWAAASLRHARRDPEFPWGPERPRLPKRELWNLALGSMLKAYSPRALDTMYARTMADAPAASR